MLDYYAPGHHLLLDGVVTIPYRNTRHRETGEIPGFAAKLVEDEKFFADKTSERPIAMIHGGKHTLVLFAIEDGGRLGAHAHAFSRTLLERVVRHHRGILVGMSSVVTGSPKSQSESKGGSATFPHGSTYPCRGNSLGYSVPIRRRRTSSPRESL
jgi:hypothetical protein